MSNAKMSLATNVENSAVGTQQLYLTWPGELYRFEGNEVCLRVVVPTRAAGRLRIGFGIPWLDTNATLRATMQGVVREAHNELTPGAPAPAFVEFDLAERDCPQGDCLVWVSSPDGRFSIEANYTEQAFARTGDGEPVIPWNFWFFPFSKAQGEMTAWNSTVVDPMGKYEKAFATVGVRSWECENHSGDEHLPSWQGHCLQAAIASILFAQPADIGVEHNGVRFLREEVKLLAAEVVDWIANVESHRLSQKIYAGRKVSDLSVVEGRDLLGHMLPAIRLFLARWGEPFVCDLRGGASEQVWNHAVFKYENVLRQTLSNGLMAVQCRLVLFANKDAWKCDDQPWNPGYVSTRSGKPHVFPDRTSCATRFIEFDVSFDEGGSEVMDSSWTRLRAIYMLVEKGDKIERHSTYPPSAAVRVLGLWPHPFPPPTTVRPGEPKHVGNPLVSFANVRKLVPLRPHFEPKDGMA